MPRIRCSTLYEDQKIRITYYPGNTPEHILDVLDSSIHWHHYHFKEGFLAQLAGINDISRFTGAVDRQSEHLLSYLLSSRINVPAFFGIVKEAYSNQEKIMARAKKKK